jgi:sugar-specific transcriptional regulator TrmB
MRLMDSVYKLSYNSDDMAAGELEKSLSQLGLGGHEPAVYAALLEQSPAGAALIAKKCGLSRSSVYTTLSALVAKGLVGTTHQNDVKQFVAEGHGALLELLRKQEEQASARLRLAESLSARLEQLAEASMHLPQIVHFEGQQGLKRIYLAMLRAAPAGATMSILRDEFIWRPEWAFVFEREWRERVRRLKAEKDIATRLLVNRSPVERAHAAFYRTRPRLERRHLRRPVRAFGLYLVGDMAAILSVEENNLIGLRIVNRHIAANLGELFAGLWHGAARPR